MQTFNIRDLRERSGQLVREAEEGHLSVVSKHGHPLFVAVPLDEAALGQGVGVALACRLYAEHTLSLSKAALFAGMPIEAFMQVLGSMSIPVFDHSIADLDRELDLLK